MATYHEGPAPQRPSFIAFVLRLAFRLLVYALLLSIALVVIYRFLPVPTTVTMLMDSNGAKRDWTAIEDISPNMLRAVIAAEDTKFCEHDGFDREAIEKAIAENAAGKRRRGASTISQQTAKNVFLWQGGGLFRKGLEAGFTFMIETVWGKRRILEVYMNVAETGIGTYGVEAGAQRYYKKSAKKLTRIEAARMAAALPSPKKRSVVGARGYTRRYGNRIAARMNIVKRHKLDSCIQD